MLYSRAVFVPETFGKSRLGELPWNRRYRSSLVVSGCHPVGAVPVDETPNGLLRLPAVVIDNTCGLRFQLDCKIWTMAGSSMDLKNETDDKAQHVARLVHMGMSV